MLITLLPDEVTVTAPDRTSRHCMDLLSRLADASSGLASIQDPVAWQKAQRAERHLPYREA